MTTYGLVGVHHSRADTNPGSRFITDGIRWLLQQCDPEAVFIPIDMLYDDKAGWRCAIEQADLIVLCGNPRFNLDPQGVYWDLGIWESVLDAFDAGIPFLDAWAGASHPYPVTDPSTMAEAIGRLPKIKTILAHESRAICCVARDQLAYELLRSANRNTELLPCSTWHAAQAYGIAPQDKTYHCITIRRMPGNAWVVQRAIELQRELEAELPTYIATHCIDDHQWVRNCGATRRMVCLPDAQSLLTFYSRVDKLLSLRVHATIPALSLGAKVCNVSIDARSLTVDLFGLASVPLLNLQDPSVRLRFEPCPSRPRLDAVKSTFRRVIDTAVVLSETRSRRVCQKA